MYNSVYFGAVHVLNQWDILSISLLTILPTHIFIEFKQYPFSLIFGMQTCLHVISLEDSVEGGFGTCDLYM